MVVVSLLGCPGPLTPDSGSGGGSGGGGGGATGGGTTGGGDGEMTGGGGGGGTGGGVGGGGGGGGDAGTDPCLQCATGLCETDGGCRQCLTDADCSGATPRCELVGHTCVECLPGGGACPAGQYCTDALHCEQGCERATDCNSQRCLPTHECFECLTDSECTAGRVCGTGVCGAPCTGSTCADGGVCCSGRCVELARDDDHCGSCGNDCAATQFCNGTTCRPVALSSLCEAPRAIALLDEFRIDGDAGVRLGAALTAACSPPTMVSVVFAADAGTLMDVTTGQPWVRGGTTLAVAGGPFGQKLVGYLERSGATQVKFASANFGGDLLFVRSDGGVLVNVPYTTVTDGHDWFLIELVKEPLRGSASIITYALGANGTLAAVHYVETQILPTRSAWTKSWYVLEWVDSGNLVADNADTFTLIASGP
jgi:hypothetical protein